MNAQGTTIDDFQIFGNEFFGCDCCYFKIECMIEKPDLARKLDEKYGDCDDERTGHVYELKRNIR